MEDASVWALIAGKLSGEASKEELDKIEALAENNEGLRFYLDVLDAYWNSPLFRSCNDFEYLFENITGRLGMYR